METNGAASATDQAGAADQAGAGDRTGAGGGAGRRPPGVPRWAESAAHAVPLTALPSGLWRIAVVLGVPLTDRYDPSWWEPYYLILLSVLMEGAALLTFGLVRRWGEAVPDRVPFLAGRRIPRPAVVVTASLGAVLMTALAVYATWGAVTGKTENIGGTAQQWVVICAYAPLLAWGPLLAAVTFAYWRRTTPSASRDHMASSRPSLT